MDRTQEFGIKLERVERYLAEHGLGGVVLARSDNFAWIGCGANNVVNSAQETGVGTLVVRPGHVTLLANNVETERLMTEELAGLDVEPADPFPWHDPAERERRIAKLCAGGSFASDDGSTGLPALPEGFQRLRYSLTEAEVARYRVLGADASAAIESAARAVEPGMTEAEVAGLLAGRCFSKGLLPVVLLVAADERVRNWRHPVVTSLPAKRCAMLVLCGRRQGLVAAVSRLVHFGELPETLAARHRAVCAVDAAMMVATVPGRGASEVFARAQQAYAENGFPDEWKHHHQGGATGYRPREYIATEHCREIIASRQAFAWNPSIRGTKSEDTIVAGPDGFSFITRPSADWPTITVEADGKPVRRADILVK